jgi:hypothetical protein
MSEHFLTGDRPLPPPRLDALRLAARAGMIAIPHEVATGSDAQLRAWWLEHVCTGSSTFRPSRIRLPF